MIKVKAIQSFVHNNINARKGEELSLNPTLANDLRKADLVEFVSGGTKPKLRNTKPRQSRNTKPAPGAETKE